MFVILGGTGKIGRVTARELRLRGEAVRVVARTAAKTDDLTAIGCQIAIADLHDAGALARAFIGATAVQVICPANPTAQRPWEDMQGCIMSVADALSRVPPAAVLAISDYGAEIAEGTGITLAFHHLEEALKTLPPRLTILRSSEHMQNWQRSIKSTIETGILPSLHYPVTKLFPTISAADVGLIAADLLLSDNSSVLRIVHAEGPRRYSANDVADILSNILGREIIGRALPRSDWVQSLQRADISAAYANLVAKMFDVHNAGRIDVETGGEVRRGQTSLQDVLLSIVDQTQQ